MRLVANRRVQVYGWTRSSPRPNGNERDCNGAQLRLRIGRWWWNAEFTARTIHRQWNRGKSQVEFTVYRVGLNGRRDRNYRKRFLRITLGSGGEGVGSEGGSNR